MKMYSDCYLSVTLIDQCLDSQDCYLSITLCPCLVSKQYSGCVEKEYCKCSDCVKVCE